MRLNVPSMSESVPQWDARRGRRRAAPATHVRISQPLRHPETRPKGRVREAGPHHVRRQPAAERCEPTRPDCTGRPTFPGCAAKAFNRGAHWAPRLAFVRTSRLLAGLALRTKYDRVEPGARAGLSPF